ncbi:MAG TPA: IPT/TIG domain-containing protein [Candidatus Dormibacteraeota bacterium]|nr:IPT/TIG domain-containing protein [Candidatus Dormibacteraeota bacterium]
MRTVNTILIATLTALTLACGYSAKTTPPVAGSVPVISQLNPSSTTAGDPAFTLTVTGTSFGTKAVVNWNGIAQTANTAYVSSTQLTVAVPATAVATSGTVQVTVTNPGTAGTGQYGGGGTLPETSMPMAFTIN